MCSWAGPPSAVTQHVQSGIAISKLKDVGTLLKEIYDEWMGSWKKPKFPKCNIPNFYIMLIGFDYNVLKIHADSH